MELNEPVLKPSAELLEIERRKRPGPRTENAARSLEPSPELCEQINRRRAPTHGAP